MNPLRSAIIYDFIRRILLTSLILVVCLLTGMHLWLRIADFSWRIRADRVIVNDYNSWDCCEQSTFGMKRTILLNRDHKSFPSQQIEEYVRPGLFGSPLHRVEKRVVPDSWGTLLHIADEHRAHHPSVYIYGETTVGWPAELWRRRWWSVPNNSAALQRLAIGAAPATVGGVQLGSSDLRWRGVIWVGAISLSAAVVGGLFHLLSALRRVGLGRCYCCGYQLSVSQTVCPECGAYGRVGSFAGTPSA